MINRVACTVPRRDLSDLLRFADVGSDDVAGTDHLTLTGIAVPADFAEPPSEDQSLDHPQITQIAQIGGPLPTSAGRVRGRHGGR